MRMSKRQMNKYTAVADFYGDEFRSIWTRGLSRLETFFTEHLKVRSLDRVKRFLKFGISLPIVTFRRIDDCRFLGGTLTPPKSSAPRALLLIRMLGMDPNRIIIDNILAKGFQDGKRWPISTRWMGEMPLVAAITLHELAHWAHFHRGARTKGADNVEQGHELEKVVLGGLIGPDIPEEVEALKIARDGQPKR